MKRLSVLLVILWLSLPAAAQQRRNAEPLYFPGDGEWETISPQSRNLNVDALNAAIDFAMERRSSSVVVLLGGRILAERHREPEASALRYRSMIHGKNADGHVIEDVASVQKSVVSMLVGIALEKGLVKLEDPVHRHLGAGWSKATARQEAEVTLRHLITMTSGLSEQLEFVAPAGTRWAYNSTAYARTLDVIVAASGKQPNDVTGEWLTGPLGMKDSTWVERRISARSDEAAARYGFATTARDLARFGLMVLAEGQWNGQSVVSNTDYFKAAMSPSQQLNPAYGYLWWLNGQKFVLRGRLRVPGPLIDGAPQDLVAAQGALGRKCYVVPSRQLVVTRLGDHPEKAGQPKFNEEFWRLLKLAAAK